MITNEGDIVIILRNELKSLGEANVTVNFADWDSRLGFQTGSTKEHIKTAAQSMGYDVVMEGTSMIELNKPSFGAIRLQRG
jgi:hypothetical protein